MCYVDFCFWPRCSHMDQVYLLTRNNQKTNNNRWNMYMEWDFSFKTLDISQGRIVIPETGNKWGSSYDAQADRLERVARLWCREGYPTRGAWRLPELRRQSWESRGTKEVRILERRHLHTENSEVCKESLQKTAEQWSTHTCKDNYLRSRK